MSRILLNTKTWLLFVLLFGISFSAWAQSDDFNTWTKFKVNHKIDSRFSVSGDLELRMKDDVSKLDRWGADCWRKLPTLFIFESGGWL